MASLEREIHQWLRREIGHSLRSDVLIGVGDDAAVISGSGLLSVITTDTIAEGTHFLTAEHSLELIGRKSLAVNLSDIAAMGATPKSVVLHWLLPSSFSLAQTKQLFSGIKQLADQHQVQIIGGDTNCWDGPLVIGATAIGELRSQELAWRMSGGTCGDPIFVSGRFGGSLLGHHLSFEPAVELACELAKLNIVSAATDATDSLTRDLSALATASNCGAEILLDQIPIADAAREQAKFELNDGTGLSIDQRALQHALADGEDFGLILAISEDKLERLEAAPKLRSQLTRIGTLVDRKGLWSKQADGGLEPIAIEGYDH